MVTLGGDSARRLEMFESGLFGMRWVDIGGELRGELTSRVSRGYCELLDCLKIPLGGLLWENLRKVHLARQIAGPNDFYNRLYIAYPEPQRRGAERVYLISRIVAGYS